MCIIKVSRIINLIETLQHQGIKILFIVLWLQPKSLAEFEKDQLIQILSETFPLKLFGLDSDFYIIRIRHQTQNSEVIRNPIEMLELYSIKELRISKTVDIEFEFKRGSIFNDLLRKGSRRQDLRGVTISGAGIVSPRR